MTCSIGSMIYDRKRNIRTCPMIIFWIMYRYKYIVTNVPLIDIYNTFEHVQLRYILDILWTYEVVTNVLPMDVYNISEHVQVGIYFGHPMNIQICDKRISYGCP